MLLILPSYKVLNAFKKCLEFNADLNKRLNKVKKIFTETKDSF